MESVLSCEYALVAGGGTKGVAYVGIIDALERNLGDSWHSHYTSKMKGFAGSSAGSIIALCLALRLTAEEIRTIAHPVLEDIRTIVPNPDLSTFVNSYGIDNGCGIVQIVRNILQRGGLAEDTTFERLFALTQREFACTGLNLNTVAVHVFSRQTTPHMTVSDAVRISTAVPLVFTPVLFGGDLYVDGALGCNIPDVFPAGQCMLWCLENAKRISVGGWVDYVHAVTQISMAAQRAKDLHMRQECGFCVNVRMPDVLLNGTAMNLKQTTTMSDVLISCGFAACCDALSRGGLYSALAAVTMAVVPRGSIPTSKPPG